MAETLTRNYHGIEIESRQNETPVEQSDGWSHHIGEHAFSTLAEAIRYAKELNGVAAESTQPSETFADSFPESDDPTND